MSPLQKRLLKTGVICWSAWRRPPQQGEGRAERRQWQNPESLKSRHSIVGLRLLNLHNLAAWQNTHWEHIFPGKRQKLSGTWEEHGRCTIFAWWDSSRVELNVGVSSRMQETSQVCFQTRQNVEVPKEEIVSMLKGLYCRLCVCYIIANILLRGIVLEQFIATTFVNCSKQGIRYYNKGKTLLLSSNWHGPELISQVCTRIDGLLSLCPIQEDKVCQKFHISDPGKVLL